MQTHGLLITSSRDFPNVREEIDQNRLPALIEVPMEQCHLFLETLGGLNQRLGGLPEALLLLDELLDLASQN